MVNLEMRPNKMGWAERTEKRIQRALKRATRIAVGGRIFQSQGHAADVILPAYDRIIAHAEKLRWVVRC